MAEVWEQQEGESDATFSAFLYFRESPAPRKLVEVYRDFTKDPTKKQPSGRWAQWGAQYKWFERANAFDRHLDAVRTQAKEKAVAEVHHERAREIETSALSTLQETASIAHASITDVLEWDEVKFAGGTLKASKDIPQHVAAAISKVNVTHDKQGNPNITVEMHGKVRPLDLLGPHFSLWENAKEQAQKAQTNAFLEFLNFIKSGAMDSIPWEGPEPSLKNPPPWITVDIPGVTK